jgi:hypothetical protein
LNEEQPDVVSELAADLEGGSDRDLFRLVLTVVDLSRQLMEKQVARDSGELSDAQREALALALERLEEAMEGFRRHYGLPVSDLEIDLDTLTSRLPEGGSRKGHAE